MAWQMIEIEGWLKQKEILFEEIFQFRDKVNATSNDKAKAEKILRNWKNFQKDYSDQTTAYTRYAILRWALGDTDNAIKILKEVEQTEEVLFCLGSFCLEKNRPKEALKYLSLLADKNKDRIVVAQRLIESRIKVGEFETAQKELEVLQQKYPDNPDVLYLQGLLLEYQGFLEDAVSVYEKVLEIQPEHARAMFKIAYISDCVGDEETARNFYQQLAKNRFVQGLVNLGIYYEDAENYEDALSCISNVVENYPVNWRYKLFWQDIIAGKKSQDSMQQIIREERRSKTLSLLVSDLPIETKIISALHRANITTIGDLVDKTEEDLLIVAGLDRAAIRIIKEALTTKGLALASEQVPQLDIISRTPPEILNKPLATIPWSARVKTLFDKMGLATVGDLLKKTEKEIREIKSVGDRTIQEIKTKLNELGLSLPK